MARQISNDSVRFRLDTYTQLFDAVGAGFIRIFDGTQPPTAEDPDNGTVLAQPVLNATAFGTTVDTNPHATATANAIGMVLATAAGTATYYRAYNNAGTCIEQGSAGTSGADMILNNTTFAINDEVRINSWVLTDYEFAP